MDNLQNRATWLFNEFISTFGVPVELIYNGGSRYKMSVPREGLSTQAEDEIKTWASRFKLIAEEYQHNLLLY